LGWNLLGITLLLFVAATFLLLVALTATLVRDAAGEAVSFHVYLTLFAKYLTSPSLGPDEREVVVGIAQPLVLALSVIALLLPVVLLLKQKIDSHRAVICCFTRSREKNRRKTARELAKRFATADDICIVSGDFSWFIEDGGAGLEALNAIVSKAGKGNHHLNIISYKSIEDVEKALDALDPALRAKFIGLVRTAPYLQGMKMTIINCQDYRKLYMISGAMDGEAEQMVVVNDRDYGRKLINTFQGLVAA
jgi:hypothetical protein